MPAPRATQSSERPRFWASLARWIASCLNSFVHFVPLLLVSPFSHRTAFAIYRHWGRTAYRIFGVTLSLRDDNNGDPGPKPHLYVWLNQHNLAEAVVFGELPLPFRAVTNVEYA